MKVLIVNTSDVGGAANACLRLHEGLLKSGIDSKVILMQKSKYIPNTYEIQAPKRSFLKRAKTILNKLLKELKLNKSTQNEEAKFLKLRAPRLELFSFPFSEYNIMDSDWYKEADIINLHWVAGFLDYSTFFSNNKKPVVWTMHDMNVFTGGEHYTETILGEDNNGTLILRKKTNLETQVDKFYLQYKTQVLKNVKNLTLVAPSKWLFNEASNSNVLKDKSIKHIPYGLNSNVFNIREKFYSRKLLDIPLDKKVILFVAESLNNTRRKGFAFLLKAFQQLEDNNVILCAVGNKKVKLTSTKNLLELGSINDDRMMSVVYSAADVFIIPSLMDNLPNTVLESLMCGTPVIGFPVGGILDMVENEVNGFVAKDISAKSLNEAITLFLNSNQHFNTNSIRNVAVKKYNLQVQANNYISLFNTLLN